jgi:Kazal-type serine protease inhibitor domain
MKRPILLVCSLAIPSAIVMLGLCLPANAAGRDHAVILAQGAPPQVCTEVYQPVCGTNQSGMRVTYSNACFARAAQATNVTPGECSK